MKLTPWYPGDVKPVRVGVYERLYYDGERTCFSRFDGASWRAGWAGIYRAQDDWWPRSSYQDLPWRGLASPDGK